MEGLPEAEESGSLKTCPGLSDAWAQMSSVSSLVTLNESILTEPQCSDLQHREGYPFPGLPQSICSTRQCAHLSGLPPGSHAKTRVGVRQRSSSDV